MPNRLFLIRITKLMLVGVIFSFALSCASTDVIESPKTAFVSDTGEVKIPAVIWTSRNMTQNFDYLGLVKSRSWTYDGALDRLVEAGKQLRADAIVDVHFERVGFLNTMQAFAIKYK